jgi:hypothetical protein
MKIHYAVEIWTNTILTDAAMGLKDGVFRFVTDRPKYDLSTVIPKYGPDEIDIDGNSIADINVPYEFYEKFLVKDAFTSNPSRLIDIISCGSYSTDSKFSFTIRNDIKFWNYCQTNNIYLTGQRVVMWIVLDDIFYQCSRGRIVNNPYTEIDFQFNVDDDASLIHKNIPPRLSVLPSDSASSSSMTQGDSIPVVFGNVPYSKILKNNLDNYILPLNTPYNPAAATAYNIVSDIPQLTLFSSEVFTADDTRLVGMYLSIIAGSNADRIYKIISNTASASGLVTISFNTPLIASSSGDSSADVLLVPSDFNNPANHYRLTGAAPPYTSTAATWWFQISDYSQESYVSNNSVTVSDILEYNSEVKKYGSVSNLLNLASTPNPTVELTANTASKDGKVTQFERINVPLIGYGSGYGKAPNPFYISDHFTSESDILLVTDKLRATMQLGFSTLMMYNDYCIFADYHPQPIQPADENQVLSGGYSSIYFCVDMFIRGTGHFHLSMALQYEVTDLNNAIIAGSVGLSPDTVYRIPVYAPGRNINFVPNSLISDSIIDPSTSFGQQARNDGKTYRIILKINDADPSIFASAQYKNIRLKLYLTTNDVTMLEVKEICLVGERSVATITADLFARTKGETVGNDGLTETNNVYNAFRHILEDYDNIPTALIDYGTLADDRDEWMVSRTLTERKNSVDYLNELCAHSFVGMFSGRTGKRVLRAFQGAGALTPTPGTGKTQIHNKSLIVKNSISKYEKSSVDNLYNSFFLQYCYDAGSNGFIRSFNVAHIEENAFPDVTALDPNGDPLWWSYFSGLQTSIDDPDVGYADSKIIWDICHASYLINNVVHQAQGDISQLNWFADSLIFDSTDSSGTGLVSSAFLLLQLLAQWTTLQKDIVAYSIPLNANTIGTELLDIIKFNDTLLTNGVNKTGWITNIEYDIPNDQIKLEVTLQPIGVIEENLIVERGPLLNVDTITESGAQPDTITEIGV